MSKYPKFVFEKIADSCQQDEQSVLVNGEEIGTVFRVIADQDWWQYSGNPFPRATFKGRWRAARKLYDRHMRGSSYRRTVAFLNGRPLTQ